MKAVAVVFLSLVWVSVIAAPTPGEETDQEALTQYKRAQLSKSAVVCKRITQLGTHFKKRVCLKRGGWDRVAKESQETVRRLGEVTARTTEE